MFEPLTMDGRRRSADYHATRFSMLSHLLAKKIDQADHAADLVEQAAADLAEAANQYIAEPSGWALGF